MSERDVVQRGYRIRGHVQGVFFRAWTRHTALDLGLGGTVKNCPDGSVEAHFVGPVSEVERMEALLWEGPAASRVDAVERVESTHGLQDQAFQILH
ncbi:MAG: acylphosphatase [Longimicrobiales bacterium]